ncbi:MULTISPECIES: hypothetical protein [unclassified Brevundimonas]|uniref:hypothetical protein n=1 Tax=unclassified Brevundimonas TaxID=2622653 RepID=UPI0025B7E384|nr:MULTISPECIES: hypothetical protein [unclassified Brevundimonas]
MASSGTAQITAWVAKTKERIAAVRNESVQRVVEAMQTPVGAGGNMPVDTGFLRASLVAQIGYGVPPLRERPDSDAKHSWNPVGIQLILAGAEASDTITIAYSANYARHQEYGSNGRMGRRFVALAAQQWPQIVAEVCREAESRAGG